MTPFWCYAGNNRTAALGGRTRPRQLLDQSRHLAPRLEMRHVADFREAVHRHEAAQVFRVVSGRDAVLAAEHHLHRNLRRDQTIANVDNLPAIGEQRLGEAALGRDERPFRPLPKCGGRHRRPQ